MAFPNAEDANLEIPGVRDEAIRDAKGFMERHKSPVIFDEIQNTPELVSYVQAESDTSQSSMPDE